MTNQPFRFLHAADLHLESPVNGLAEVPEHLADRVLDAPRRAAERVFQAALTEKVDFVILSGDMIAPSATGPWGPLFLIEQFEKLRIEGIPVYWGAGKADTPEDWPAVLTLPSNVHRFPVGEVEEVILRRDGSPLVRILGTSYGKLAPTISGGDFPTDPEGLFSIGIWYGKPSVETLKSGGMHYWGLGGNHTREFLARSPSMIHSPGSTLSRNPREADGCASLVEVNEFGRINVQGVKTSPILWGNERIVVRGEFDEDAVLSEMRTRLANRKKTLGDVILFISWRFDVPAKMVSEFRHGNLAPTLLRDLRSDFGRETPTIWSVDLEPTLPNRLPVELYDQQTILGDFLRMVHFYQENPTEEIDLGDFFSQELLDWRAQQARLATERLRMVGKAISDENPADGEADTSSGAAVAPVHSFRPEVPHLVRMLSLSPDEFLRGKGPGDATTTPAAKEWMERLASLRADGLREAAALGIELLSGQGEEARSSSGPPVRKNSRLAEERRLTSLYLDGKENLS